MKIIILTTRGDYLGGSHTHFLSIAKMMKSKGVNVIVAAGYGIPLKDRCEKFGLNYVQIKNLVHKIQPIKDFFALIEIYKMLRREKPELVACHSSKAGLIGRICCKISKTRCVFTVHGWSCMPGVSPLKRTIYWLFEQIGLIINSNIIVVSKNDLDIAKSHHLFEHRNFKVVHNGVNSEKNYIGVVRNSERGKNCNICKFVMTARFAHPKRQLELIKIFQRISSNWELHFIGDGPELSVCQDYVSNCNLEYRVIFHGQIDNVQELLYKFDVFILYSSYESLPISIIEGMQSGLPIISSDVGGCRELVSQNIEGLLVKYGEENDLINAIEKMAMDQEFRSNCGEKALHKANNQFSEKECFIQTIKCYEYFFPDCDFGILKENSPEYNI